MVIINVMGKIQRTTCPISGRFSVDELYLTPGQLIALSSGWCVTTAICLGDDCIFFFRITHKRMT